MRLCSLIQMRLSAVNNIACSQMQKTSLSEVFSWLMWVYINNHGIKYGAMMALKMPFKIKPKVA